MVKSVLDGVIGFLPALNVLELSDPEEVFRKAQENDLGPNTFTLGRFSDDATWNIMFSGVLNHREDGVENLDWGRPNGLNLFVIGLRPNRLLQ